MSDYKKVDFNVPALQNDGTQLLRQVVDRNKLTKLPDGSIIAETVLDEEGFIKQEVVPLRQILAGIVNNLYPGEEELPHADRTARGKLSRKLSDDTGGSNKNYTNAELEILRHCLVRAMAVPAILSQVEDLITFNETDTKAA